MKYNSITSELNYFGKVTPFKLAEKYGTPLYVYNEEILRRNCREVKQMCDYQNFRVNYSAKANCNPALLRIIRSEGLFVDAMSPGEITVQKLAGFKPSEIFYIGNNVSVDEMKFAVDQGILCSVDSLSQLETFGKKFPGKKVAVRFNPGVGAGHHAKVVTGGSKTKFGIDADLINEVKSVLKLYNLKLSGINQHIGSLFMSGKPYLEGAKAILDIAKQFEDLDFIDLGGGFGIPYHKYDKEKRLDLAKLGKELSPVLHDFAKEYGKQIIFKIEPGRYIPAEAGLVLGTVHSVKRNYGNKYVGTDIGFNVLMRPVLYDSYQELEAYRKDREFEDTMEETTVVGNICETGDILASGRLMPLLQEGDLIGVLDAGAYGFAMASNYNNRLRPAEVLIQTNGDAVLIRKRDSFEDLTRNYII